MKFVVQRDPLLKSVQDVMKAISSRTAIPILTGMKIEAKQNGIVLTGSDSDISIESHIQAESDGIVNVDQIEEGSIVLQARYGQDVTSAQSEVQTGNQEQNSPTASSEVDEVSLSAENAESTIEESKRTSDSETIEETETVDHIASKQSNSQPTVDSSAVPSTEENITQPNE